MGQTTRSGAGAGAGAVVCAGAGAVGVLLMIGGVASAAYTTVINNGPSANRVDMVFLGDGYRAIDLPSVYPAHINSMVAHLFSQGQDPYPRYHNFFNVHRVDVVSTDAGADVPPLGIFKNTALDATYYGDGVTERLLTLSNTKANAALAAGLSGAPFGAEVKYVAVNDSRYGGSGGTYATYAGGNSSATEIALHESGHSFNKLADEYGGDPGTYPSGEPTEINVTKNSSGAKWAHWLGYNQPVIGTIGAYEGGRYYDHGIYRPSLNSKMRSLGRPFDAVAREKIILDIYNLVDPLDSYTPNSLTLIDPVLEVDAIDPDVIDFEWSVDGFTIAGATSDTLNLAQWNVARGQHTISVRAYDPTDWVRINLQNLTQTVNWSVMVTPEPGGIVGVALVGVGLGRRRRR